MTRILLINPSVKGSMYKTPCLGMGYVGASLKKAGHDVTIFDGSLSNIDGKEIIRLVTDLYPDYIGVTAFTLQYPAAKEIFRAAKQHNRILSDEEIEETIKFQANIPEELPIDTIQEWDKEIKPKKGKGKKKN